MTTGTRKTGEFCWINMLTPQPDEAREFFGKLLGWTYDAIPGLGHLIKVSEHGIGGLFDLNGPKTPPGTPPMIGVMVKVDDADEVSQEVTLLGGKALPAFDIMDNGRMAVCHDPNGAQFDLWEPKLRHGTDVDSSMHGAPSWFETMTNDVARATKFYCELFGWTARITTNGGFEYTTFCLDGEGVAGMMSLPPHLAGAPPHWGVYFAVNDADRAAREAAELGATICVPPQDVPDVGRFCVLTSPQGVKFCVIKYVQ